MWVVRTRVWWMAYMYCAPDINGGAGGENKRAARGGSHTIATPLYQHRGENSKLSHGFIIITIINSGSFCQLFSRSSTSLVNARVLCLAAHAQGQNAPSATLSIPRTAH